MTFNRQAMFSSASGDWETPQGLFDELNKEFGFTLDACATPLNTKCPLFYSEESLDRTWPGRVFVNPPYGREIGKWVSHAYTESQCCIGNEVVVMLLPSRTDTAWFHEYVLRADEIRFIRGRLKFSGWHTSAPFPAMVVVFRGKSIG